METFLWLLCFLLLDNVVTSPIFEDDLYEGSPCKLENNSDGICKNLLECPMRLAEVREGKRTTAGRCGFIERTEVVCCPLDISEKINLRPADLACQQSENDIVAPDGVRFHILEGEVARQNEFPYIAALGYTDPEGKDGEFGGIKYDCGGTLISRQHVLTAAHCVSNIDGRVPVEVRIGSTDLSVSDDGTQRIPVRNATPHPGYKRSLNYHDVAILTLKEPVRQTNSVRPACLLSKPLSSLASTLNGSLVVPGWGAISLDGTKSNKLMKAVGLRLVDTAECSKSYAQIGRRLPRGLDDNMICAVDSDEKRKADACWGDSGGPLLYPSGSLYSVGGVTSFGRTCGGTAPGVYASVFAYLEWIEAQVWPNSED